REQAMTSRDLHSPSPKLVMADAAGPAPARQKAGGAAFAPEPEGYFEPKVYGTPREEQPAQEQAADGR
ncbi:hypothetical protein ACFQ08_28420, partial [Streptosporangium algeriense]